VIALGQAQGPQQQADGDLARKVVDELEASALADAVERALGDLERRRDKVLSVLAAERGLAQRRRRSCRGGSVVPSVAPARPGSSSIMLPWDEENVSQSSAARTMSS
jgi:hypothetical protein